MSDETLYKKRGAHIDEAGILASLESAISSYDKKDFETIAKQSLTKSKGPKRKKAILEVVEEFKKEKTKKAKVLKSKSFKTKAKVNRSKRRSLKLLSKINFVTPVLNLLKYVSNRYKRQLMTLGLTFAMICFVGFSSYIAYAYVAGNNNDVVQKVEKHVVLPSGETPKVYIIQSEKSDIFQNPLFKGIAVGDNVLSYPNAGKVIIYRGGQDKIVNIVNTTQ